MAHSTAYWSPKKATKTFQMIAMSPNITIAVGTAIAGRPPHRSVRAELPHTALTLDVDWQTLHLDKDVGSSESVTIVD